MRRRTGKARRTEMGGVGMRGQVETKVGGQTVMPIGARRKHPCHAIRESGGKGEVREILASSFVRGGYRKLF